MRNHYTQTTGAQRSLFPATKTIAGFFFCIAFLFAFTGARSQSITDYAFTTSTGTFTYLSGSTAPALSSGSLDDGTYDNLPIGFSFCYMSQTYTTFSAGTNGWATLGQAASTALTNNLSTGTPRPVLAPLWDDLEVNAATGSFSYMTTGAPGSRILTAEWKNMEWNYLAAGPVVSFQMKLYEGTNVVEFIYNPEAGTINNPSASVGITASGTGAGNFLSANSLTTGATVSSTVETTTINTQPAAGLTFDFTPPAPAVPPINLTFTGVGASAMTLNWVDNSTTESGFTVWRSVDNITFTQVATIPSTSMATTGTGYNFNATGLFSNTLYYWRIFATNANCPTGFLAGQQSTNPGTLCGTFTIGPTGSYTSLTAAIAAVQANGVACPLVFELQAAYVSTVETFPIVVPFLGSGPTTNITVRPELGATNLSITSNAAVTIDMNAASYFVFDGRPGGVGTSRELTIENTSTAGIAARFQQDAQSSGYTYCKIRGVNTSTVSGVIVFGNAATNVGNSNNNINNCDIFDSGTQPTNLVYALNSTAATFSTNNTFTNNLFHDWFSATAASSAMTISTGNSAWTISNNSFYQTATRTHTVGTLHFVINATPGSGTATGGFVISGNFIGGTAANCGGTPYTENGNVATRFTAIQTQTGTGGANSIQGNTITNFNFSTTSSTSTTNGIWCGINLLGTNAANNVGNIAPNMIGSTTANGAVTTSTTISGGLTIGMNSSATGVQVISNNQVGGLTANSSAITVSTNLIGIQVSSGTSVTISGNLIGSLTSVNNMINASSTSATGVQVTGINCSAFTSNNISNNTVMNLTNQYAGTSTTDYVRGIATTSGPNTINNNTIANLLSSSNTNSITLPNVVGIYQSSGTAGHTISNNTITNLASASTTGSPNLYGIYYTGSTIGTNRIFNNKITGIGAPLNTGTPIVAGIYVNGGVSRYYNNMILLGVDATGASITQAHEYDGFLKVTTSNNSFFYNSVKIAGTGVNSGVPNTYAFRRSAASGTDSLYNNVFTNFRSNATTGGTHYAIGVANTTTLRSNNNDFYGNGTGFAMGIVGATVYTGLSNWVAATGLDLNSYAVDPNFVSATNLHINTAITSALESRGATINGIAFDIDSDVRPGPVGSVNGGGTAPDLGADEFDGIPLQIDMGVTVLVAPSTTGCHTTTETIRVRIKNFASQAIDFSTNPVTIVSYTQGINPQAFPNVVINTGTLAGNGTIDTAVTTTYNMTAVGTHIFRAYTNTPGDLVNSNDSLPAVSVVISGGTYTSANNGHICLGATTTLNVAGYTNGGTIQWQESPDNITWTNVAGATTASYTLTPADTTFYRAVICGLWNSSVDTVFPEYVAPPTTIGATRCGPGQVTLSASGTGSLRWYNQPTGGSQVNSGTTYTTNVLQSDTFYVEAASGTPPTAFLTTLAAGNGSAGNMFAITALNTITISSFDGHMPAGTATWEIWYMPQNYTLVTGSTTSNAAWTFIGSAPNVVSNGNGVATPIPVNVNITIPAGSTYSFYVTTTGPTINYTNGTAVGNIYAQNADLQFREGHGGGYFSVLNQPRVWNGYIHYSSGCSSATRTPAIATVTAPPVIAMTAANSSLCGTDTTVLSVSSPNAGYTYTWSPAANLNSTSGDSVMWMPTTPGSYTYYVDASDPVSGCANRDTLTVHMSMPPVITATANDSSVCRGTMVNLNAATPNPNVQISSGSLVNTSTTYPAPYGNWYGGARHQMLILASELTAAGLTAGNIDGMTFQVTNTNASAALMNFTIQMGMTNVSTLTTTFQTIPMTTVYTNASYAPSVGVNTHTFSTPFYWDGVSNIIIETCFVNQTGPASTSFTTNCTMLQTATAFGSTTVVFADNNLGICSVTTGTVYNQRPNIGFVRSFSTYTFGWTPVTAVSNPAIQNPTATMISSTDFMVTTTDTLTGCSTVDSVMVTVLPTPSPSLGADTIICSNTPLTLDASAGNYTYLWQDNSTAQTLTVNTFGNYYVLVTDNTSGCAASDTILVGVNAAPSFSLGSDVTVCSGTNVTFSGPSGPYHYLWNTSDTTMSVSENTAGNYQLTVTDSTNNCFNSDTVMLTVNPLPVVALGNDTAICASNAPLVLSAPSGNYSYTWSDNSTGQTLNVSNTGTFDVVVTDNTTSCFSSDTIVVNVNPNPTVSLGNDTTYCSAQGPITLMAPAGPYNYLWSDNTTGNTLTTNTTGNYSLTVTDSVSGCATVDAINITVNQTPAAILADTSLCGTVYVAQASTGSGYNYLWNTGATSSSIIINSPGGAYYVTVTNGFTGCSVTDSATIMVNTPPVVTLDLPNSACTTDSPLTMNGAPAGGTYSGPGITGNTFNPGVAGSGTFTITYYYTDPNGCSDSASDIISVSPCVGVQEQVLAAGMSVFPNPNNGLFTFTIKDANYSELTIEVVTVEGQVIYSDKSSGVTGDFVKPIDLGAYANGIYFLRVTADGQNYVQKIVKQQ